MLVLAMASCSKSPELSLRVPEIRDGRVSIIYANPQSMSRHNQDDIVFVSDFKNGEIDVKLDDINIEGRLINCGLIIESKEDKDVFINLPLPLEKGKKIIVNVSDIEAGKGGLDIRTSYKGSKHAEDFNEFWNKFYIISRNESRYNADNLNELFQKYVDVYKSYIDEYPESGIPYMLLISQLSSMQYSKDNPLFAYAEDICVDIYKNDWKEMFCRLVGEKMLSYDLSAKLVFKAEDIEGRFYSERDISGELILIDFWASWCKPCKEDLPMLRELHRKYKDRGLTIVGISIDHNRQDWENYLRLNSIPWTSLIGEGQTITRRYDFEYIPFYMIADREGNIIQKNIRGKELTGFIEEYFN